jgi:glycosyltransferase involved in cell wall biosynthesis
MLPRISVVMSVFNGRPFLSEAVESVLMQSFTDFEFIIIDDSSTDGSSAYLNQMAKSDSRIVLMQNQENLGLTASLNRGLAEARGEFIARQDADDVSLPERFSKQVAAFEADDDLALIGTGIVEIDEQGHRGVKSLQPSLQAVIQRKMLFENAFFHPSIMWRREVFNRACLKYDEDFFYGQDYELFSRAVWRLKASNLREPLLHFRAHGGQVSKGRAEAQQKLADGVAWRNFSNFGLANDFKQDNVILMRSLGWRSLGLDNTRRREQWNLWRRLFRRLEQDLSDAEHLQWQEVKKVRLILLRRSLATWPPVLPELAGVLACDPWGAIQDVASVAARRLKVGV